MLNVPQEIRQQIAQTGEMYYPKLQEIFEMESEEEADEVLLKLGRKHAGPRLAIPWIYSAPLLLENHAIEALVLTNPNLRMLLPEVITTEEAAFIAQAEFGLSEKLNLLLLQKLRSTRL